MFRNYYSVSGCVQVVVPGVDTAVMRESARRVVVTGVGILSIESGAAKTWRAVLDGRSGVKALGPDD
eukprot:6457-Eustigmatos_ZCMA.PRE.1